MSKKKFKKKKNKKHSQPVYVAPKPVVANVQSSELNDQMIEDTTAEEVAEPQVESKTYDAVIPPEEEKEYAYVRKDVKKILIVMGSIVALLIVAFIVNDKTTLFHSMGNWLYNMLNIQTQ